MNKQRFKDAKGYTLVEIVMVMGIMGVVGLGAASIMKNAMSIQRRQTLRPTVRQIKYELEQAFLDDDTWEFSFNHANNNATGLQCLRDTVGNCADVNGINSAAFVLRDPVSGGVIYDERGAGNGWTYDGTPCNTWSNAGNDACPIRYDLAVRYDCPGGGNCNRPSIEFTGRLLFRPSDRSNTSNRLNISEYDINIRRGERVNAEPFRIWQEQTAAGNNGGGECVAANQWYTRRLNRISPPAPIGVAFNNASDQFTLQPGRYECQLTIEAFGPIDGVKYAIRNITAGNTRVPAGSAIGPPTATVVSHLSFRLAPNVATTYDIQQWCVNDGVPPGNSADNSIYEFGLPRGAAAPYATQSGSHDPANPKIFTLLECIRSS